VLLERIFLVFTGLGFLAYGSMCLVRPETLVDAAGFTLTSDVARVEVQAMYGGLQIAVGLLALAGLQDGFRHVAIATLTFLFVGLAIGRGYGMFLSDFPGAYNQFAIGYEIVSAAIAAYLLSHLDESSLHSW
jgi:hypothetical protein